MITGYKATITAHSSTGEAQVTEMNYYLETYGTEDRVIKAIGADMNNLSVHGFKFTVDVTPIEDYPINGDYEFAPVRPINDDLGKVIIDCMISPSTFYNKSTDKDYFLLIDLHYIWTDGDHNCYPTRKGLKRTGWEAIKRKPSPHQGTRDIFWEYQAGLDSVKLSSGVRCF